LPNLLSYPGFHALEPLPYELNRAVALAVTLQKAPRRRR
jgi:hypothetical protein